MSIFFTAFMMCLEVVSGLGEAGFELFQLEIQLHAAVELGFLGGAGRDSGDFTGEAFVLGQGSAAALSGVADDDVVFQLVGPNLKVSSRLCASDGIRPNGMLAEGRALQAQFLPGKAGLSRPTITSP